MSYEPSNAVKLAQAAALLAALKASPVSTYDARDRLGLASPAARVLDLRRAGHVITTTASTVLDAQGRPHRVAVYHLEGLT